MSDLQVSNSLGGFYRMFKQISSEIKFPLNWNFTAEFHSLNKEGNMLNLWFSCPWLWTVLSSGMGRRVVWWKFTGVSEKRISPICRIEDQPNYVTRKKNSASCLYHPGCLDCSLTLKMVALRPSETSIDVHHTTFFMATASRYPKSRLTS
jgi:hypothetical protein